MNIDLFYSEKGTGKPFILLHGNGEEHTYFEHQIEFFSKYFRVIAIDTRGHGKSPRGDRPFTIKQFAEDLYEFMVKHRIDKANILGFSDGGNIALEFVLKHPEMVEKLILNGANLNTKGLKRRIQIPIEIGYKIAYAFSEKSPEARKNKEMLGLMVNEPNIMPEELKQIMVSTLVIAGTRDMIKDSHTRLIQSNLPNSELAIISGNHFIANKNAKVYNEAVLRFLMR